jgi:hypothetical protein
VLLAEQFEQQRSECRETLNRETLDVFYELILEPSQDHHSGRAHFPPETKQAILEVDRHTRELDLVVKNPAQR